MRELLRYAAAIDPRDIRRALRQAAVTALSAAPASPAEQSALPREPDNPTPTPRAASAEGED